MIIFIIILFNLIDDILVAGISVYCRMGERIHGMKKSFNRWYDKHPELMELLGALRHSRDSEQERIIGGMKELIMGHDPELMDRWVLEFPLTTKRRWYDKNPYSWLVINSLKYADRRLVRGVIGYLKGELEPHVQ